MIALNPRQNKGQTRAFVKECPLLEYDALTREPRLADLIRRIAFTDDDLQQRQLKGYLPFRCPHYTRFNDNHRDREHIDPESFTWLTCIDIDEKELVEDAKKRAFELDNEEGGEWQGMLLHMDYSARKKLHIDIRLPFGMTVAEAQRAYCKALGVEPDTTCFTPERFIYITPADFEIYRADGWYEQLPEDEVKSRQQAYLDRGLTIDGRTEDGAYGEAPLNEKGKMKNVKLEGAEKKDYPDNFEGVPYTRIIAEYWRRTGGIPTIGSRNNKLHKLAANLRAICENKEGWLLQVMPRLGLTETEMKSIVHSACSKPTPGSKMMDEIVKKLHAEGTEDWDDEADNGQSSKFNVQSKKLAMGLKESLAGVPQSMHMPVLCAVLPIAAAYADQVEVEYCDGNRQRLGLMSIIRGEQASGKSVCKNVVDVWKRQFDEEDAIARKREEEWKERKKARKANEKAPDDPKVLIRTVPVTVSCSTLLKRFKNANGHCLYSFGEELDTLRKTNGAGSWSSKYDIYRLSFDNGEWGQDYNSDQAESGVVKVAYNWTMLGTDGALRKCFKSDNIENGLSSRVMVAEMPDSSFAKMPKFGKRSADDEAKIQEAVTRLRSYSGFIDTPRLRRAIERWVEEKRVEAAKDIDRVKDVYRKRAAVIGFRCGVIHHLLTTSPSLSKGEEGLTDDKKSAKGKSAPRLRRGKGEVSSSIDFALMMAEYTLEQQIKAFGEALMKEYVNARDECRRYGKNNNVFDQLPPVFTLDDLAAMRNDYLPRNSLNKIISRWNHDGWIEKTDPKHWKKVEIVTK